MVQVAALENDGAVEQAVTQRTTTAGENGCAEHRHRGYSADCIAMVPIEFQANAFQKKSFSNFESIGRWWICNNKNTVWNCVCAATLWSIWKLCNQLCFQGGRWQGGGQVLCSIARMLKRWRVL